MRFARPEADVFVPHDGDPAAALARTTHLCVIAHQDDIEINAYPAIADCFGRPDRFLTGVTVTNGAGSARSGRFADFTDSQMQAVRREEQRAAAWLGQYNLQIQLAHPSADVKQAGHVGVRADLDAIFAACRPQVVYLHQPLDKHDTHVAVLLRCLDALRRLPPDQRPSQVLGVEAWRGLEWLLDTDKVALDAAAHPGLKLPLMQVFASQIAGGKRYDTAAIGRRQANATFHDSHATDRYTELCWALDLTPLVQNDRLSVIDFAAGHIDRVRSDVVTRLGRLGA